MTRIHVRPLQLVALPLLVLSVLALAHFKTAAQQVTKPNALAVDPVLREIANYRQWTRANETPLLIFNPGMSIAI